MRRIITVSAMVLGLGLAGVAPALAASNPNGQGPPSQSCQDVVAGGGMVPGHTAGSPGSPFNEPTLTNPGGIGGQHYTEKSQYDVACYQISPK